MPVIPATIEHLAPIAARLRAADLAEIAASSGMAPANALSTSFKLSSVAMTGVVDGVPIAMFGVADWSAFGSEGLIWLLGTDAIDENAVEFLRESRRWVHEFSGRYARLHNMVDDRHSAAKRWLRWLGFSVGEPIEYGVERRLFRPFELRQGHV